MKVSIIVPTYQGERWIGECLEGLLAQETAFPFDILVIDSSSTDRTVEIARRAGVRVVVIDQRDFDHGDTRNLGARLTDGDAIVFFVQDAVPADRSFLSRLVRNLELPEVAGAYARVVPRADASFFARRLVEQDLNHRAERIEARIERPGDLEGMDPLERRILCNFNDVASAVRRDVWRRLPLARVAFGEDLLFARAALEAGWRIVYDPEAVVVHSHEYDPPALFERARIDGWFNRAYFDRICVASRRDARVQAKRQAREDVAALERESGRRASRAERRRIFALRRAAALGAWRGGRTSDRLRAPSAAHDGALSVLFFVHSFPPESWAGTELLTRDLARALSRRGHRVAVLAGSQRPGAESEEPGLEEGVRVWRFARTRAQSLAETIHRPETLVRFEQVAEAFRPDVVHFQHFLGGSFDLARRAHELGLGVVTTLNDFYAVCPRVQWMRPDGSICPGGDPGLGCRACLRGATRAIAPLALLSRWVRSLLRAPPTSALPDGRSAAGTARAYLWRNRAVREEILFSDRVIAPSRFLAEALVREGWPPRRLLVSDYGIDTAFADRVTRRPPDGRLVVGYLGSLVPHKGLEVAARAVRRVADRGVALHVFGPHEGSDVFERTRESVRRIAGPAVRFLGPVAPEERARVFSSIDVLVVPSLWYENSPLVVHEAFAAGVPVLASRLGGLAGLVAEGRGGFLFPPGDDRALAALLERFARDPQRMRREAGEPPPVKTLEEWAEESEVLYRQVVGLVRSRSEVARPIEGAALRGDGEERVAALIEREDPRTLEAALDVDVEAVAGEGRLSLLSGGAEVLRVRVDRAARIVRSAVLKLPARPVRLEVAASGVRGRAAVRLLRTSEPRP